MKQYRKRFVQLTMFLIGLVLFLMMGIIAVYLYHDYYNGLQTTMAQVVEPLGSLSERSPAEAIPDAPPSQTDDSNSTTDSLQPPDKPSNDADSENSERPKDIMTIFYAADSEDFSVLSQVSLFDDDTLMTVLKEVSAQTDSFGTLSDYHVIYYRTGNGDPYKIALTSTRYIWHSILQLAGVLAAIWIVTMLCFLFLSIQLSKLAVRPMEQAMQREKQFVANASHDLKTPLSVILANNSILIENPDATVGSLKRWTDSTQTAAKNMQQLIGEMLTLADVERPDTTPAITNVDFASVAMKAELQLESVAYEKGVSLDSDIPDELMISSNEDYLQRITSSLIENALKYEPSGGSVWLRLSEKKRAAVLEIQNHSTVIAAEDLPHVFDRFYRSDKSRQSETGGHGLGLAITKQMTEKLGGTISVTSDSENGTIFSVVIPLS